LPSGSTHYYHSSNSKLTGHLTCLARDKKKQSNALSSASSYFKQTHSYYHKPPGRPRAWLADNKARIILSTLERILNNNKNDKPQINDTQIIQALHQLRCNKDIRVVLSDKGGAFVLLDADQYRLLAMDSMDNNNNYLLLSGSDHCDLLLSAACNQRFHITEALTKGGYLTSAEWSSIISQQPQPSPVIFKPKLHKPLDNNKKIFKSRPVVNTLRSVIRPVDKYLAIIITPLMTKIPFNCNSTREVLRRLQLFNRAFSKSSLSTSNTAVVLRTFDIVSLFPSIAIQPAIDATCRLYAEWYPWLLSYYSVLSLLPPPPVLLFRQCLEFVLTNNLLSSESTCSYYLQTSGVAMGACISVFVANCYVWEAMRPSCTLLDLRWDNSHIINTDPHSNEENNNDYNLNHIIQNHAVLFLCRYVDDMFTVTLDNHSADNLTKQFSADSALLFTTTYSSGLDKSIKFLDLVLSWNPRIGVIATNTHKMTNTLLSFQSNHPLHIKKSVVYSQFIRVARNCLTLGGINNQNIQNYLSSCMKLEKRFLLRGYPRILITNSQVKAFLHVLHNRTRHPETGRTFNLFIPASKFSTFNKPTLRRLRTLLTKLLVHAAQFYSTQGKYATCIKNMLLKSRARIVVMLKS